MNAVFGPVPSSRLGLSLGIDPLPVKTCTYNCVYCQLGRTVFTTCKRREYLSSATILAQLEDALVQTRGTPIDWLTIVGRGEPTLNAGVGWLISTIKSLSSLPVAVITNGSLLHLAEVRQQLRAADAVLPSLDAGSSSLFSTISRCHPQCGFDRTVEGLRAFRRDYTGRLLLEVMLVAGVNDSEQAMADLAAVVRDIEPDEIHLLTPTRPPAEPWVLPVTNTLFQDAASLLSSVAPVVTPGAGALDLELVAPSEQRVLDVVRRHPLCTQEIEELRTPCAPQLAAALDALEKRKEIKRVRRLQRDFWVAANALFPDESATRGRQAAVMKQASTSRAMS